MNKKVLTIILIFAGLATVGVLVLKNIGSGCKPCTSSSVTVESENMTNKPEGATAAAAPTEEKKENTSTLDNNMKDKNKVESKVNSKKCASKCKKSKKEEKKQKFSPHSKGK